MSSKKYSSNRFELFISLIRNLNLQTKILIVAILPALICMVIQGIVAFKSSSELMMKDALLANDRTFDDLNGKVYDYFYSFTKKMLFAYNYIDEMNNLELFTEGDANSKIFLYGFTEKIFLERFEFNDKVLGIYLYSINNDLISSYKPKIISSTYYSDILRTQENVKARPLQNYISSETTDEFIDSYYNNEYHTNILRMGIKLRDAFNQKVLGCLVIDINDSTLVKILNDYIIYSNQEVFLQNLNRGIITSTNTSFYKQQDNKHYEQRNTYNEIILSKEVPKFRLNLVSVFPLKSINKNASKIAATLIILISILCIVAFVLTYFLALTVTRPVRKLSKVMEQVETEDTFIRINIKSNDEVGKLGKSFNLMMDRLEDLIIKEYKTTLLKNQAQLKALQAQINPHFLYNTLQAMGSMAKSQKAAGISEMCLVLSDIFRYSINMKGSLTTIYKEINHVKNYMFIQNVRFLNKFRMKIYCSQDLYKYAVPKLSLQPLIENSIEHGLVNKSGIKLIKVKFYLEGKELGIMIADNGVGFDRLKLKELRDQLSDKKNLALEKDGSIAILNVNERMRIIFGDKYGLNIYSKEGKGTVIILKLPLQELEEHY